LIGFGGNIAVSYVIFNWISNADNILIGWYWGAGPLGLYSRAYNLLILALNQITPGPSALRYPLSAESRGMRSFFCALLILRIINFDRMDQRFPFWFSFVAAEPVIVLVLERSGGKQRPFSQVLPSRLLDNCFSSRRLWLFL